MIYRKLRDLLTGAGLPEYAADGGSLSARMLRAACAHLENMYARSDGAAWDISVDKDSMTVTAEETVGFVASDAIDDSLRQLALLADSMVFAAEETDGRQYVKITVKFSISCI